MSGRIMGPRWSISCPAVPFAQLPMTGTEDFPHVSAIVWTEQAALATRMMALDDAAFGREITRRLGDHLGAVRPVGRRWIYQLGALHAHRYMADRMVLVGDAAHGIHPIAGQGLNLGLRDVIAPAGPGARRRGGGRGPRRYSPARPVSGDAPPGQPAHARGDPCAGSAVLDRQPAGADHPGCRHRRGAPAAVAQAGFHAPGDGRLIRASGRGNLPPARGRAPDPPAG